MLKNVLLILGGAIIIASALFTLSHMTDRTVFTVLIPGFVFGLVLIGVGMRLGGDRPHRSGS